MYQIRIGMEDNLDVSVYADPNFDTAQMKELRLGLMKSLPVEMFAKPDIPAKKMHALKLCLLLELLDEYNEIYKSNWTISDYSRVMNTLELKWKNYHPTLQSNSEITADDLITKLLSDTNI